MDWHPIQGEVAIFLVASATETGSLRIVVRQLFRVIYSLLNNSPLSMSDFNLRFSENRFSKFVQLLSSEKIPTPG